MINIKYMCIIFFFCGTVSSGGAPRVSEKCVPRGRIARLHLSRPASVALAPMPRHFSEPSHYVTTGVPSLTSMPCMEWVRSFLLASLLFAGNLTRR